MIELKVTLKNIKSPNDVVKKLNEMIDEMSFILPIISVKAITNGNHIGYGLIHIRENKPTQLTDESKRELSKIVRNIVLAFQKSIDIKQIEIYHSEDELTNYFLYEYHIIGGNEKDNYIKIEEI